MPDLPTTAEQKNLVELARAKGFDALDFLQKVMAGKFLAIGEKKPIPVALRIAAADLLRKYASLPTNVNLEVDTRKMLVYRGDAGLTPLPPGQLPPDAPAD